MSDPCAVSWGPDRLDIFVVGPGQSLFHKAWDGQAWTPSMTGWDDLGGTCLSAPTATCWGPNRIDVFVQA
jgi:hypothetical protein